MKTLSKSDLKRTIILDTGDDSWEITMKDIADALSKEGYVIYPTISRESFN